MNKYFVVPQWLIETLEANGFDKSVCLKLSELKSILSVEELSFYLEVNSSDFISCINDKTSRSALKRLAENVDFSNPINEQRMELECYSNYYCAGITTQGLVTGPMSLKQPDSKMSHMLWLMPVLFGQGIIGLVPTYSKRPDGDYVRRDIYEVLKRYMAVEDILKHPLFGL